MAALSGSSPGRGSAPTSSPILSVSRTATQAIDAAAPALRKAVDDEGLNFAFYLLTQVAIASRSDDWLRALDQLGIKVGPDDGLVALVSELQERVDEHIFETHSSGDIAEMAQQAAGEAILHLTSADASTLFGEDQGSVQKAIRRFATTRGFGQLGQQFFGRFVARILTFYLSRITAPNVGTTRLPDVGHLVSFNDALRRHCVESAFIVRDFAGEWYSKTGYFRGIDRANTRGFIAVALKKLEAELLVQRDE